MVMLLVLFNDYANQGVTSSGAFLEQVLATFP